MASAERGTIGRFRGLEGGLARTSLGAFLPSDHSAEMGDAGTQRTSGDNHPLILAQKFIIRGHSKGVLGRENRYLVPITEVRRRPRDFPRAL